MFSDKDVLVLLLVPALTVLLSEFSAGAACDDDSPDVEDAPLLLIVSPCSWFFSPEWISLRAIVASVSKPRSTWEGVRGWFPRVRGAERGFETWGTPLSVGVLCREKNIPPRTLPSVCR